MLKKDLLEKIKDLKDDDSIDEILLSADEVKNHVDTSNKKYYDKEFKKWEKEKLQGIIDEKVKELYPEEDPKDSELKKLKLEIEQIQKENAKKELTNKALKLATEKKLPAELVDFFVGADEESTIKNLTKYEEVFKKSYSEEKKKDLADKSYTPPKGDDGSDVDTGLMLAQEANESATVENDPWS